MTGVQTVSTAGHRRGPAGPAHGGSPADFFAAALAGRPLRAVLADGQSVLLPTERWLGPVDDADELVLARATEPVLDVGCGPGRHVHALAARGVVALGIDASRSAVRLARHRGAAAVTCDVFDDVPAAGSWHTALLLDGNIGIGGDPVRLLERMRELVVPGGTLAVEVGPPGGLTGRVRVRLECDGAVSAPLPWAVVAADQVNRIAASAAVRVMDTFCTGRRWFTMLRT